ncbi:MAG: hypothetical protein WCO60_02615 [Verrucomicrobiota bacterium]
MCKISHRVSIGVCALVFGLASLHAQEAAPKVDLKYPFRVGWANEHLPWYQCKTGEFPPHHSDKRIGGELVQADFVHRKGQFRVNKTGELMDFTMPPYGTVNYLNTEADLRDIPLGTFFLFFLNQDPDGEFTRLATMQDQFTMDAGHGFSYRIEEVKVSEGKLVLRKQSPKKNQPDLGQSELEVSAQTRYWKGEQQVELNDVAVGDVVLFNKTGAFGDGRGRCTDLWIGEETHQKVSEIQRAKHAEFVKFRGRPGWVDKADGNEVTVSLFSGEASAYERTYLEGFKVGMDMRVIVANDELRTWHVGRHNERAKLKELKKTAVSAYGTSGFQMTFTVDNMLEGFRKGRVVRLFGSEWKGDSQPYGESLSGYGFDGMRTPELDENVAKEYPTQFPFRTEYGNRDLPWYQLKAGVVPPLFSEHVAFGELLEVDSLNGSGKFQMDRTGQVVSFELTREKARYKVCVNKPSTHAAPAYFEERIASVRYLNTEASLSDIPIGTRCRFHLYQDETGAFTRASLVSDEFSYMANSFLSYKIESIDLTQNRLTVTRGIPEVRDYNGDLQQPLPVGRTFLSLKDQTRLWKGEQPAKAADLSVGDMLFVNLSGEYPGHPSTCTEIWIGKETHAQITEVQIKKNKTAKH